MDDNTRLDCSDIPCSKHQKFNEQSCPECEIEVLQKELAEVKAEAARYKSHLENICADFTWSLSAAKKEARLGLEE